VVQNGFAVLGLNVADGLLITRALEAFARLRDLSQVAADTLLPKRKEEWVGPFCGDNSLVGAPSKREARCQRFHDQEETAEASQLSLRTVDSLISRGQPSAFVASGDGL